METETERFLNGVKARLSNSMTNNQRITMIKKYILSMTQRKIAINLFCQGCILSLSNDEMRECQGYGCGLYFFRPSKDLKISKKEVKTGLEEILEGLKNNPQDGDR